MIGGLIAVLIAYWFYRTAEARGLPNVQWAFAGLIAFYIPNFIWKLGVANPLMNSLHAQNAAGTAGFLNFSSVLVGVAVAALVHFLVLKKVKASASPG